MDLGECIWGWGQVGHPLHFGPEAVGLRELQGKMGSEGGGSGAASGGILRASRPMGHLLDLWGGPLTGHQCRQPKALSRRMSQSRCQRGESSDWLSVGFQGTWDGVGEDSFEGALHSPSLLNRVSDLCFQQVLELPQLLCRQRTQPCFLCFPVSGTLKMG